MKLREVRFNKWIVREEIGEGAFRRTKEGTCCWQKDFPNKGLFHQWGSDFEEFENGVGNLTIAII